jgi:hypothetical protein
MFALVIAGDTDAREQLNRMLTAEAQAALSSNMVRVHESNLAQLLYEQQDLLRFLPAIIRNSSDDDLKGRATELLCAASQLRIERESDEALVAAANFQESVLRTIDAALHDGWDASDFDLSVARAVAALPRTVADGARVANARIRATIATIRTAIHLAKRGAAHSTAAVTALFNSLREYSSPWSNTGIPEACYIGLSELIVSPAHDRLTRSALDILFQQITCPPSINDLSHTHQRLVANASLRRLLIHLANRSHEDQLLAGGSHRRVYLTEQQIAEILSNPNPQVLRNIFCHDCIAREQTSRLSSQLADRLIGGVAFETDILKRTQSMLAAWREQSSLDQTTLIRILATQLHTVSRDIPALTREHLFQVPGISLASSDARRIASHILATLPSGAAEAADLELHRFAEIVGRSDTTEPISPERLPPHVASMITPTVSARIARAIAREFDLIIRRSKRRARSDIAKPLYEVVFHGGSETIFDHLLPRVSNSTDHAIVLFFRDHAAALRDANATTDTIKVHIDQLPKELSSHSTPTLSLMLEALSTYRELTSRSPDSWKCLAHGGLSTFFNQHDLISHGLDNASRTTLADSYGHNLQDLQQQVKNYLATPIESFTARSTALRGCTRTALAVAKSLQAHRGLHHSEQTLFVTLMTHLAMLFRDSIRWYCEWPVLLIQQAEGELPHQPRGATAAGQNATTLFWESLCLSPPPPRGPLPGSSILIKDGASPAARNSGAYRAAELDNIGAILGPRPPAFDHQDLLFQDFFVRWRAASLDIKGLNTVLSERWPPSFRTFYRFATNPWLPLLVLLLAYAWAVAMDLLNFHWLEGAGFFALSAAVIIGAVVTFVRGMRKSASRERLSPEKGYWFECLLPRLARLTAVPMALIVEVDHSYDFALTGTSLALLLLIGLSYLSTGFFVSREVAKRAEKSGSDALNTREKAAAARRVVALALSHAFGIAILMSAIFGTSHALHDTPLATHPMPHGANHAKVAYEAEAGPHPLHQHRYPYFLRVLPRETTLDLGHIWGLTTGNTVSSNLAPYLAFRFYPTLILTWTAFGLFFGVFLEGFMAGKSLRDAAPANTSH